MKNSASRVALSGGGHFYICPGPKNIGPRPMSDHNFEGHFPEEAEQNEIGGQVLLALMILTSIVLVIWAMS